MDTPITNPGLYPPPQYVPETVTAPGGSICRACLHGIRGQAVDGNCSECNAPIARALDRAWWGNAPIGYLRDLLPVARHAMIAAAMVPLLQLIVKVAMPATIAMRAQSNVAIIAVAIVSLGATAAAAAFTARFFWRAAALGVPRDRRLTLAAWGCVVAGCFTFLVGVSPLIIGVILPFMQLVFWVMLGALIASPLAVLLAARAFVVMAPHVGGENLKRLGIAHGVLGLLHLLVSIPVIIAYASLLQGSFGMGWMRWVPSWLPSLSNWVGIAPTITLPVMLLLFMTGLKRIVEARRAGA
jgi:hypothetical protein